MESPPTTEAVYQGVYTLYNNTNTVEQEKASKWLEQLQNSVSFSIIHLKYFTMKTICRNQEIKKLNFLAKTNDITTL